MQKRFIDNINKSTKMIGINYLLTTSCNDRIIS